MAHDKTYAAAVIGLGNVGFKFDLDPKRASVTWTHAKAYATSGRVRFTAAVEPDQENARLFHKVYPDVPVYATPAAMFARHKLDIVSVSVPTASHADAVQEVLGQDVRAVFCEKPLTDSPERSEKLIELSRRKDVHFLVNYPRRWEASYRQARQLLGSGMIGDLRTVHLLYPGQVHNIGSHLFITLFMYVTDVICRVSAVGVTRDVADPFLSGYLETPKGVVVTFAATGKREDLVFEIDLVGTEGRLRILENGTRLEAYRFTESARYSGYRELVDQKIPMPSVNDRFADAVQNIVDLLDGKDVVAQSSAKDALRVDQLIACVKLSAQHGGCVQECSI